MRIWILFLLLSPLGFAQQLNWVSTQALEAEQFVGYDKYNHLYYIQAGVLHKTGELGDFVFRDYQLGPISAVDLINPLNIVVYYAEVNTVVFLDNRLNETERINFNNLPGFINAAAVSNAGNNRVWVFDLDTQQLKLLDYRSQRQTVFSMPYEGTPLAMASDFNDCYLLMDDMLFQVNIYGSLLSEQAHEGYTALARYGKKLIAARESELFWVSPSTVIPLQAEFIEKPIKDLQLTQDFLYIYDGQNVFTFSLNQPK